LVSQADAKRAVYWARRRLEALQRVSSRLKSVQAEINQWFGSLFAAVIEGKHPHRSIVATGGDVTIISQKRLPPASGRLPFDASRRQPAVKVRGTAIVRRETAGTGGIHSISGVRRKDGSYEYVIEGEVLPPLSREKAPNFNNNPKGNWYLTADELGVHGWDRAHLWGPIFGDEAAAGIMYAPAKVNQELQKAIESRISYARQLASESGGALKLRAVAKSHPTGRHTSFIGQQRGGEFLTEVEYTLRLIDGNGKEIGVRRIAFEIGPPPEGNILQLDLGGFPVDLDDRPNR
jgi:hypothetical protein